MLGKTFEKREKLPLNAIFVNITAENDLWTITTTRKSGSFHKQNKIVKVNIIV